MSRIAIVTPHMTTGDAVCNDVFGMHEALRRRGYESRIYASDWSVNSFGKWLGLKVKSVMLERAFWPISKIGNFLETRDDLLIYHYSMGWPLGLALLKELPCAKVIKYHNVTPPEFFAGWSEDYENVCRNGRQEIGLIAKANADLFLSDSKYNMSELIAAGAERSRSRVVPPFHHTDRLHSLAPCLDILDRYRDGKINLLMVGRVSPNKGHVSLIEAFATYHHNYNDQSRLIIVGKEPKSLRDYSLYLRETVRRLELEDDVVFTGEVNEEFLKTYYLLADIFMITSEHEGFCVPLVEAMSMKIPILAYNSAAMAETIGCAGVVWDERNSDLMAESIHYIVTNESTGAELGFSGWQRYLELYSTRRIEVEFLDALSGLV